MKHSDPGPMSDPGDCNVRSLCVDLCSLIAESRVPGLTERGYGPGVHCPPLIGPPRHACDLTQPQCQKHQIIIQHLLEAAASNIFQIEVLLLPECCLESKLKERIQNKEYILVERWSMNFTHGKVETTIEISHLLRAVRSFLHFSQLSAWYSSTSGKSPANICYWVNPELEALCTKFKEEPEVHYFPTCKINDDLYGTVKVEFPTRAQYIPIVPCSKHPPVCRHSLREINKDSNVCQSPSDVQTAGQLHKTSDTEPNNLSTINFVPEPEVLVLPPSSFLKALSTAIPDGTKANRVLKHSNLQANLSNSASLSIDAKSKTIDIIQKKSSFVCNYAETFSLGVSQENFCCNERKLARRLHKTELKLKKLKREVSTPLTSESSQLLPTDAYKLNQNLMKPSLQMAEIRQISNLLESNESLLNSMECNLKNIEHSLSNSFNLSRKVGTTTKAFKRKDCCQTDNLYVLPNKKLFCDKNISLQMSEIPSAITLTTLQSQYIESSQVKETVKPLKKAGKEFIKQSSSVFAIPNYCNNDAKMLEMKYQQYSDYLCTSPKLSESVLTSNKQDCLNSKISQTSTEFSDKTIICNVLKQSKINVSLSNPESKLFKRKCSFQFDYQTNVRKRTKSLDGDDKNFYLDTTCNVSEPNVGNTNQTSCLNLVESIMNSSERSVLNGTKLEKHKLSCSWSESKPLSNHSKHLVVNNISLSKAQDSNFAKQKDNCILKTKFHERKQFSKKYSKSSLHSLSMHQKNKSQRQKTNLRRSYRLLLASDQLPSDKSFGKLSNSSRENATQIKQIPSFEKSKKLPKEILRKKQDGSIMKNSEKFPVKKEKAIFKDLKLNKLFKFKKGNSQTSYQRKSNMNSITKQCSLKGTSYSSPSTKVNTTDSPLNDCESTISSSNKVDEIKINPLDKNSCSTTSLPNSNKASKVIGLKNDISTCQFNSSINALKLNSLQSNSQNSIVPFYLRNVNYGKDEHLKFSSTRTTKFPKAKRLLMNFEESILKGCLPVVNNVKGFHAEIGASGSFCPSHLTLPADVSFYELGHSNQGTFPYVAHVSLKNSEYYLPKKGAVQVTLFNPSETVVKMFVLNYDLSNMPPLCHTFIRQKTYFLPVGLHKEYPASQKWLRFIIHLRFASSKTGRITLHEDFKIVVLNKTNDDAASEFSQEPRELCSFISVPVNPTFSAI